MRCSYRHRPLRVLSRRHPQRLLLPRCRVCGRYTLGLVHKAALVLPADILAYVALGFLPLFLK